MTADPRDLHQRLLNLLRKKVYALHNKHIIAAARNSVEAHRSPTARTFVSRQDPREVAGIEPYDWDGLTSKRGENHLPYFTISNRSMSHRIDNFADILILPNVDAVVGCTVHSRSADAACLGHTVDVERLYPKTVLDPLAHFIAECFGAEDANSKIRQDRALLVHNFHYANTVAHHTHKAFNVEVLHHLYLTRSVA